MRSQPPKASAESWRRKCIAFCSGIDLSAVLPKFAVDSDRSETESRIPRNNPRRLLLDPSTSLGMAGLSWDYLDDSRSNLPKSAESVGAVWLFALSVFATAITARTQTLMPTPARVQCFSGRGNNHPHFRDAKAGAHLHSRHSGAARADHRPQWCAAGAKQTQL